MPEKRLIIFMILLMGFILNMISVQIVGSSFKYLQAELNASVDQISYVMSASLIAEVIIIPFSGWLARLLSTRYLFLISLGGFLVASVGCALSNNFVYVFGLLHFNTSKNNSLMIDQFLNNYQR